MFALQVPFRGMCYCNQPCCHQGSPVVEISDESFDVYSGDDEVESDDGVYVLISESSSSQQDWPLVCSRAATSSDNDKSDRSSSGSRGRRRGPTPMTTTDTMPDSSPHHSSGAAPSRRKRARRAVPYEFTAPSDAGELKYAKVAVVGDGVIVKKSSILESGNGLFADRDFKKGELITEYHGEILDRDEVELRCQLGQFQYIGTLRPQQYYIDGIREPQQGLGGASFINHSSTVNSVWHEIEDRKICFTRKFARATRDIRRGEEIFVNYGRTYWQRMRRWHDTIEQEGLENISDFEGDVEYDCDYTDYLKEPNKPPN